MKERIEELIKKYKETVVEHYHYLHAHPELSGQEKETAAYIANELRKMGLEPTEGVGGYGVVALIKGNGEGKCVGLRADFDALPIQEETDLPFASTVPGVMHACGHDVHASMLLGCAYVLNELKDSFNGCVKLVFQPAEENSMDCGAKKMIADGVLENPKVDAMIAQHVGALYDTGIIATKEGYLHSASDRFFITLDGTGSHAARPHLGTDTVVIGSQIVSALQSLVSRNTDPMENSVVTIGKFNAGERYNVIANHAEMEGTCRNYNEEIRSKNEKRMGEIVKGIAEGMGAEYTFRYVRGYSPNVNNKEMFELLKETVLELYGEEKAKIPCVPSMGGEDFSFFSAQVPSIYFNTGVHKPGTPYYSTHNEHFVADEDAFPVGINVMVTTALKYLERN